MSYFLVEKIVLSEAMKSVFLHIYTCTLKLLFGMLWANSADNKSMICFLFYSENRTWHFMQIVSEIKSENWVLYRTCYFRQVKYIVKEHWGIKNSCCTQLALLDRSDIKWKRTSDCCTKLLARGYIYCERALWESENDRSTELVVLDMLNIHRKSTGGIRKMTVVVLSWLF